MGFSRQEYKNGLPHPPPGDLPNPRIEPRSPILQADSLPSEPPGKLKNIGVCSLSLLQGIFLSQELNWSLLHCRGIICQLSYQGSPFLFYILKYFSNFSLSPYSDCTFFSWISAFHIWSLSLCFSLDPDPMTHCTCMVLNSPSAFESFFDSQYICTVWWKDDIAKRKELSYSYNTNEALTEFWHNLSFLYPVYPIKV